MTKKGASPTGTIYLLHFDTPYTARTGGRRQIQHYLGWTTDLDARMLLHHQGKGARLLAIVREEGITWTLARTWTGGRADERKLKQRKKHRELCPICRAARRPPGQQSLFDKKGKP